MIAEHKSTSRIPGRTPARARAHRACSKMSGHLIGSSVGAFALLTLSATTAAAQDTPAPSGAPSLPDAHDDDGPGSDRPSVLEERIQELSARLTKAEEERQKAAAPPFSWSGYVDFGFFAPHGNNGVGWYRDAGNEQFPQHSNYSWTFLGDILGTPVNTRGEAADLGDAPDAVRFDSVHSRGAASFIVNEVNLRPRYQLSDAAIMRASINFAPRTGSNFALGDFMDVDLAEMEYLLTKDGKTSIFAGKMLPVFGIEYKERKSDQRFGVTPSLISRYTVGSQLGLKIRSKLLDDWLILAGSVTNNSSTIEQFHFQSEIDRNNGKMLNGRVAVSFPVGQFYGRNDRIELGGSGEWGVQDRQVAFGNPLTNNVGGKMWFVGGDLQFLGTDYALRAQIMKGKAAGTPMGVDDTWGLDLNWSGYVQAEWQFISRLGVSLRAEMRDAIVTLDPTRIYITKQARYTASVRAIIAANALVKAEYFHNDEYGGIRDFTNNMFTSSLVLSF
jgi:hypothetical protein